MKGMSLMFEDGDYERIPKPRRTWVMERLMEALNGLDGGGSGLVEYAYVLADRGFVTVFASGLGAGLDNLGVSKVDKFDPEFVLKKGTVEVARKEGWFEGQKVAPDQKFVFRTAKGVEVSHGTSPADAWKRLGYEGVTASWLTEKEAEEQGWFDDEQVPGNPMDV